MAEALCQHPFRARHQQHVLRLDIARARLLGVPRTQRVLDLLDVGWALRVACPAGAAAGPGGGMRVSRGAKRQPQEGLEQQPAPQPTSELKRGYWANIGQSVLRRPFFRDGGCLATSGAWHSYEYDCAIDGVDAVLLQGAAAGSTPTASFTNHQLVCLAGEAFFAASVASFTYALYLNPYGLWWRAPGCMGE